MKPVIVSTSVAKPIAEAYEFLEVLPNHEGFNDHMLVDWDFSGPRRGVGARAQARANTIGSQDWTDFEIVEAEPPGRIVEEGVGNKGKRHTRGTYRLEQLPDGGTEISFEFEWIAAAKAERLAPPLIRAFVRRTNGIAMKRLAERLEAG